MRFELYGYLANPTNGTRVDLWHDGGSPSFGAMTFPTAGATVRTGSASANDTAAGTGGRSVTLGMLDANYEPLEIAVATGGIGPNTTSTQGMRLNYARLTGAGSNNGAVGLMKFDEAGGTVYGAIEAGEAGLNRAGFTVPKGKRGLLTDFQVIATLVSASGELTLLTDWDPVTGAEYTAGQFLVYRTWSVGRQVNALDVRDFNLVVPAKRSFKFAVKAGAASFETRVRAHIVVPNYAQRTDTADVTVA